MTEPRAGETARRGRTWPRAAAFPITGIIVACDLNCLHIPPYHNSVIPAGVEGPCVGDCFLLICRRNAADKSVRATRWRQLYWKSFRRGTHYELSSLRTYRLERV